MEWTCEKTLWTRKSYFKYTLTAKITVIITDQDKLAAIKNS